MPRSRAHSPLPAPTWRNRHGHGVRGPITGPHLPLLHSRIESFDVAVAWTAEYLKGLWPDELLDVRFEVVAAPASALGSSDVERWSVDQLGRSIVFYRVPIQRLSKLHRDDEIHRRLLVEGCVFRAVAEFLDRDPWDLAPERFRRY